MAANDLDIVVTGIRKNKTFRFPQREPYFQSSCELTGGLASNFMLGCEQSDSEFLVRFDFSDFNRKDYESELLMGVDFLCKNPEVCAYQPIYLIENEKTGKRFFLKKFQGSGVIYRRRCFLNCGAYDKTLDFQADLDFFIRFTIGHKIYVANSYVYEWALGENRSLNNKDRILMARKLILNKYGLMDDAVHHFGMYAYYQEVL